jgi:hypothetical protein
MTQAANVAIESSQINSSGVLQVAGGGSGAATLTGILYGNGTSAFTAASQAQALSLIGTLPIANGGTNNGSLAVTAGGVLYTDGSKVVNVGAGTSGQVLTSAGASAPSWATPSGGSGLLLNIQYFTSGGTYTATSGTTFVIVEVIGGGGGTGGTGTAGGTSSFGAFCSATGGSQSVTNSGTSAGGSGASGDLNVSGGYGSGSAFNGYNNKSVVYMFAVGGYAATGFAGRGASQYTQSSGSFNVQAGGGAGYARKKITSGFSGTTVTVGAAGSSGSGGTFVAAQAGIVIVYEYK